MRLIDAAGWLLAGTGLPWLAHATENPQVPLHASEATWPVHQNDYCELVQWYISRDSGSPSPASPSAPRNLADHGKDSG